VEANDKLFAIKWDSLCKHVGCKKTQKNIGSMKKGEWYYTKSCKHVKNLVEFVSCNHQTIAQQVANGIARKRTRKVMHFTTVLHLL
jgi:Rad3-related DNA helicase